MPPQSGALFFIRHVRIHCGGHKPEWSAVRPANTSTMRSQTWIKMEMDRSCSKSRGSTFFSVRERAWAKWNSIEYEIVNLASHTPTPSPTAARAAWLYFRFRLVVSIVSWRSLVTSLAFTAFMIHFHFSLRVAANEWQHTNSQLGVIFSATKIRFTHRNGPNPSGEISVSLFHRVVLVCILLFVSLVFIGLSREFYLTHSTAGASRARKPATGPLFYSFVSAKR